jgi:photosystem II stability/assembly factor-like uncharacterized protein
LLRFIHEPYLILYQMRCFIVFFILFSFGIPGLLAQPWMVELSRKKPVEDANFYDIQQAFNAYWKDKNPEKGKGYKPFRRWEYFMEPRVYPEGRLPAVPLWQIIQEKQNKMAFAPAAGTEWTFIGPSRVSEDINTNEIGGAGRINCIAFHPTDPSTFWIGTPSGGIWKTINGGNTWTPTGDQLTAIGITDIAVDPQNPDNIYIATGDGDAYDTYSIGILKSTDGGMTWNATSLTQEVSENSAFRRIIIHPDNPSIMIAASYDGIYRTTDAWDSYTKVTDGHFKDLEFKPGDPSVVYAASNAKIYRSSDNGTTFMESMLGMEMDIKGELNRIELAVSAADPDVVYALCSDLANNGLYGIYKSSLSGILWNKVYGNDKINLLGWNPTGSDIGGQGFYDLALAVSPTDINDIYVGGINIWRSVNGGKDWALNSYWVHTGEVGYVHADHHILVYSPHGNILFSGNDGGISKTYDSGTTWQDISNGLHILQTYRFGISANDSGLIITGNQDNGSILLDGEGCYAVVGGDGMECFFDYTDDNIIYATLYYGDLRKSVNGGLSFTSIRPSDNPEGAWVTPFVMHPSVPGILYAGYDVIYKSTDAGKSWTRMPLDQAIDGVFRYISIAPGNDRYLYAAGYHTLVKSDDGGSAWTDITGGLPDKSITGIAVSPDDPNKLWIVFASYDTNSQVYFSEDGGQSWINYSEGLPALPVNCIVTQKGSHGGLYAGTDIGVYYRDEQLSEWIDYSGNLPNVVVNDLEIDYTTSMLKAATYGRGIWQAPVVAVDQDILRADFSLSPAVGCLNGTIVAEDKSIGNPTGYQWDFGEGAVPATADTKGPHSVVFTSAGEKNISLSVTRGISSDSEMKTGIVDIGASIEFDVAPSAVFSCGTSPVAIYATGGYDFTWSPSEGLNSTTGNMVLALPAATTTYTVTATHGSCNAEKEITVSITSNDDMCNAIALHYGMNGPFDNSCATKEENEPVPPAGSPGEGCQAQDGWCNGEDRIDNSLWFTFEAPDNGFVSIGSRGFDNQIAVYASPSCSDLSTGNYTLLAANDDYPGLLDYAACIEGINGLTPGQTYWVQVDGSFGGASGTFYLNLSDSQLSGTGYLQTDPDPFVEVFPNPSHNGLFNLRMEENHPSGIQLTVSSISGDVLHQEALPYYDTGTVIPLNLSGFHSGIYILEIHAENGIHHKKIMIP